MSFAPSHAPVRQKTRVCCLSALEQACHHCPLVLFGFLTDADAASLACACSALSTICCRSYDIKRELPIRRVLAGLYPFVARKVRFDDSDQLSFVSKLPSTVTSLSVAGQKNRWRITDLPRSLTHFSIANYSERSSLLASITAAEDWPPGLTSLQLNVPGDELPPLPPNLRAFGSTRLKVDVGCLPDSLTSLRLDIANDELWLHLPPHLTTLKMRLSSGTTTEHLAHLPASLTHFTLQGNDIVHRCFRADTAETVRLPSGLRYLRLMYVPYRAFRDLPSSLEHLAVTTFRGIDGSIRHASLQTLELPQGFNFPIAANDLPSLRELTLADGFDQSLDDLPASLRKLTLEGSLKQPLNRLPADLAEMDLSLSFYNHPMDRLPHHLLSLTLSEDFDHPLDALPSGLTRLDLSKASDFNRPLDDMPESLEVLIVPREFDQPLQQLPSSLRVLQFDYLGSFNRPLPPLPDSLSVLHLGGSFNQPLQRLPRGLTDLQLGSAFNHPLLLVKPDPALVPSQQNSSSSPSTHSSAVPDVGRQESKAMTYPVALRSLELGADFNWPLSLPRSLTSLSIPADGAFDQPLPISSLPATLTYLTLPARWIKVEGTAAVRERCPLLRLSPAFNEDDG